ncbi:hypothetical protein GLOTRDRAFT_31166 [Gloeophyllum trabeum ATCC 11539]|uniref:Conserved oligomeric Golgi complex subunit 1 n=1 Tax=Gloeophyllum trabeum (strain ATCC 11539 / FP-39264 / Madison 617) TaxID=670483 RepID=S7S3K9_GLOTA|nr:uncharacterized protein GLOTRDRAFT_31166 [Gloeophyllum trabeum ATCC 11539]EPQ60419.1 hypothetical protein GLOTRDRAFT_31166 [Gloeophyllum trabeum ATCC 11539]
MDDPDQLFVKYPVAHVKAIQSRLRADADAKQEELRQMVGERYRDLLQASTSIISLSASARHVVDALEDMKAAIPSREQISSPLESDAQLQSLQSLSTHIKLLLDAPEHIWRLLERKQYLKAAWLFLLARVVHRALSNDDADNKESWESHGIDVEEQFPLVQRQWDTVSQFRSQITHKATLSLREHAMSSTDICATLLTLHFLDSRPLVDTLSVFLSQRRRTVSSLLSDHTMRKEGNGHVYRRSSHAQTRRSKIRKSVVHEVKGKVQAVLDVISGTVSTARDIFREDADTGPCLIRRVLGFIQSDHSSSSVDALPKELQFTTISLLTDLPSSTHLLYLPQNIKAYKPYVDLSSSSSRVQPSHLHTRLHDWFDNALQDCLPSVERWLEDLNSVEEVWKVRRAVLQGLRSSKGLHDAERKRLSTALDDLYTKRVLSMWTMTLSLVARNFKETFSSVMANIGCAGNDTSSLNTFSHTLSLHLPQADGIATPNIDAFLKYKAAIRHQLSGRTTLLDQVLESLEIPALELSRSLQAVQSEKDDSEELVGSMLHEYRLEANVTCSQVLEALESSLNNLSDEQDFPLHKIIFIAQVADALESASEFSKHIGCSAQVAEDFRSGMRRLHHGSVDKWRKRNIELSVQDYWRCLTSTRHGSTSTAHRLHSRPSSALMQCLSSLVSSVHQFGMAYRPESMRGQADETLRSFMTSILTSAESEISKFDSGEALGDLVFLQKLVELRGDDWLDTSNSITSTIAMLRRKVSLILATSSRLLTHSHFHTPKFPESSPPVSLEDSSLDYLRRTQLLLDPLLPPITQEGNEKQTSLLRFGLPSAESNAYPVIDLVKPSARFGLLLIENSTLR